MSSHEEIPVWPGGAPDQELWQETGPEREHLGLDGSPRIWNVSQPTLTIYRPDPAIATGTGLVVCPGGAFHFLAIEKEGTDVARWLTAHGIAAFVLRYRLVPTPNDAAVMQAIAANPTPHRPRMDRVRPLVIADGLQAIRTIREQANHLQVDSNRIGIVGFSAGAHVAIGTALKSLDDATRPDFAVSVYGEWWEQWIPDTVPPIFLVAAYDDPLIDVRSNASLWSALYGAGKRAELHLFAHGGHGFGLAQQGLPVDAWGDRCLEWLVAEGFLPAGRA